jgi:hypothetical protein
VDLHGQIFAAPERPTHPGECQPYHLGRQVEALGELVLVHVQPLRRDVQVHAALAIGHGEPGFGPQKRLVLHAYLVLSRDDYVRLRVLGVAVHDVNVAQDVAGGM